MSVGLSFAFSTLSNVVEYEALITGLELPQKLRVYKLHVHTNSWVNENTMAVQVDRVLQPCLNMQGIRCSWLLASFFHFKKDIRRFVYSIIFELMISILL